MISALEVANVLGGYNILNRQVKSTFDLIDLIHDGVPKKSLQKIAKLLGNSEIIYDFVPEGTYKKRSKLLRPVESERVERLARIIATALHVFEDEQQAKIFMTSPHSLFRDRTPLEVSHTELGAKQVEESLWQIYYGLPL